MVNKKVSEIVTYELEQIAFEGHVFSEATVTLQIHPLTFLQVIAWRGVAYLDEHEVLRVVDWSAHDPQLIEELSQILFTSFRGLIFGKQEHPDGPWVLRSVSGQATVEESGIYVPDYSEIKKRGQVIERLKLL